MQWILDHLSPATLLSLPCDDDADWVKRYHKGLASVDALALARPGGYRGYDDVPRYRVRPGHRLRPDHVALRRLDLAVELSAARAQLDPSGLTLPPVQVSIPNALDLSLFVFPTAATAMHHLPTFRTALLDDVTAIRWKIETPTTFQLESPAILAAFDKTPRIAWPAVARLLARQLAALVLGSPVDTAWILHLCCGDLEHRPLAVPADLSGAVLVTNALRAFLAQHARPAPTVHIPMCWGEAPPPDEPHFYQPLADLHPEVTVIAGLVQETSPMRSRRALALAERALGRPVHAVAAACGLGRRTAEAAAANLALAQELTSAPPGAEASPA